MSTKTINTNLPAIALEGSLSGYLARIKKFPMLGAEEEYILSAKKIFQTSAPFNFIHEHFDASSKDFFII